MRFQLFSPAFPAPHFSFRFIHFLSIANKLSKKIYCGLRLSSGPLLSDSCCLRLLMRGGSLLCCCCPVYWCMSAVAPSLSGLSLRVYVTRLKVAVAPSSRPAVGHGPSGRSVLLQNALMASPPLVVHLKCLK